MQADQQIYVVTTIPSLTPETWNEFATSRYRCQVSGETTRSSCCCAARPSAFSHLPAWASTGRRWTRGPHPASTASAPCHDAGSGQRRGVKVSGVRL